VRQPAITNECVSRRESGVSRFRENFFDLTDIETTDRTTDKNAKSITNYELRITNPTVVVFTATWFDLIAIYVCLTP
jgi:hypothetical protein